MSDYIRQGDCLFKRVDETLTGKGVKSMVVAHGENGHNHTLIAEVGTDIIGDVTKFMLTGKARLTHGEHNEIEFPAGTYIVIKEREFDYAESQLNEIKD
jgi:predicted oxidoreductase